MRYRQTAAEDQIRSPLLVRDEEGFHQLAQLNNQTADFMAKTQQHNAEMCDLLRRMLYKQDKLLEVQRDLLNAVTQQHQLQSEHGSASRSRPSEMGDAEPKPKSDLEELDSPRVQRGNVRVQEQSFQECGSFRVKEATAGKAPNVKGERSTATDSVGQKELLHLNKSQVRDSFEKSSETEVKIQTIEKVEKEHSLDKFKKDLFGTAPSQQTQASLRSQSKETKEEYSPSTEIPSQFAVVSFELQQFTLQFKSEALSSLEEAKRSISRWLAELYHQLCHKTFTGYFSKHLTEAKYRIFFTHSVSLNFEQMARHFYKEHKWLWRLHRDSLIQHFEEESNQCIMFMQVKYPLKRKTFVSEEGRKALPTLDLSSDIEFDVMCQTDTVFEYDESRKDYERRVKIFINRLISQTREHFPGFRTLVKELFTVDRKVLKHKIGMKFRQNMPTYTPEEINKEGIGIKVPQVLRVVTKWIEELQKRIAGLLEGTLLNAMFRRKHDRLDAQGKHPYSNSNFLKKSERRRLYGLFYQLNNTVQAEIEVRQRVRSLLGVLPNFIDQYEPFFPYLKDTEVRNGLLNYALSESVANLSTKYLIFLINFLAKLSKELKNEEDGEFEFIRFSVGDLLRSKCSGTLSEIKEVYKKLSSHPKFTVYRIKNRLDTSNRDFLVNVKLADSPLLCEIQLAVTDSAASDEKELYLDHFSHFLYELSRAKYGPIGEAVIINTSLTDFSHFFEESLRKIRTEPCQDEDFKLQASVDPYSKELEFTGYHVRTNIYSFICCRCLELKKAHSSYLPNLDSKTSPMACDGEYGSENEIGEMICGQCVYTSLPAHLKSLFLLGFQLNEFMEFRKKQEQQGQKYLCILPLKAATASPTLMVNVNKSYVPAFYKTSKGKASTEQKILFHGNHCFQFKPQVKFLTVDLTQFASDMTNEGEVILKGAASLQEEVPYESEGIVFTVVCLNTNHDNLKEYLDGLRKLEETLKEQHRLVIVVHESSCLIIDFNYSIEELEDHIPVGREFSSLEATMLRRVSKWELANKSLGDFSFLQLKSGRRFDTVEDIDLTHNQLTQLSFIQSNSLKILNLSENNFSTLSLTAEQFPSLRNLDISSNRISTIRMLSHPAVEVLSLAGNDLSEIDAKEWALSSLKDIDLSNNNIESINLSPVQVPLRSINLSNCNAVGLTLPCDMTLLEELALGDNDLTEIDFSQFDLDKNKLKRLTLPGEMSALESIDISDNPELMVLDGPALKAPQIRSVSLDLLTEQSKVESLKIQGGVLTSLRVPRRTTTLLNRLKELTLSTCSRLQSLDLRSFSRDTPITTLAISTDVLNSASNEAIKELLMPETLPHLREVSISNNQIELADWSEFDYPELTNLKLDNNAIVRFRLSNHCHNIKSMNIENNLIEDLDLQMAGMTNLSQILASRNKLSSVRLPAALSSLRKINLSYNLLSVVRLQGCSTPLLSHLDISHNRLTSLSLNFDGLANLQDLVLSWNRLEVFKIPQSKLNRLMYLRLSHNLISAFQATSLPELRCLLLNHNRLLEVSIDGLQSPYFRKLDLSYNFIEKVTIVNGAKLKSIESINLQANPFGDIIPRQIMLPAKQSAPRLQSILLGVDSPEQLSIWMLEQLSKGEREELYRIFTDKTSEDNQGWDNIEQILEEGYDEVAQITEETAAKLKQVLSYTVTRLSLYSKFRWVLDMTETKEEEQ